MIETVEHLENPALGLKKCNTALRKGGILVIQTGNIKSLYAKITGRSWPYFLAGHLTYFSPNTLSKMLEKNGFKIEKIYFGDEIGIATKIRGFWSDNKLFSLKSWADFFKMFFMQTARQVHIGNMSVGGMVFYARKV